MFALQAQLRDLVKMMAERILSMAHTASYVGSVFRFNSDRMSQMAARLGG